MKERAKRFFRFRIGFMQAVLIAILLHLLLFFAPGFQNAFMPALVLNPKPVQLQKSPEEMRFRFVEVPNDKEKSNPDAKDYSDIDRRAATPEPNPQTGAAPEPLSKGQTPEAMLSVPETGVVQQKPGTRDKSQGSLKESTDSERSDYKNWIRIETIDEATEKLLSEQAAKSKRDLSEKNLARYFNFQDFGNRSSSLLQKGGIEFDTKGFDFGKWLRDFYYRVYSNWIIPLAFESLRRSGMLTLRFYVHRDGSVSGLELLDSSGVEPYDDAAMSAIARSNPFLPLPDGYPDEKMEIKCRFIYEWNPPARSWDRWNRRYK